MRTTAPQLPPRNRRLPSLSARPAAARLVEALLLALAGGLLARGFVALALDIMGAGQAAVTATGLLFLIWPGLLNLAALPFGQPPIGGDALLHLAFAVGALTGFFDGYWSIHRWRREGLIGFFLDVTWGLPGSANALLLHLINLGWGRHTAGDAERRCGAHRYERGFAPGRGFAFTQGSVMSNTGHGPGSELFAHEQVHIWQSRIAGPFFWTTYLGWQVLAIAPAILFAMMTRRPIGQTVQWWAYYNNPWEVMAYAAANPGVRAMRRP